MQSTELAELDALRRKRLDDPEVRTNGHCAACEYRGYYPIEGSGLVRSCECAMNKAVRERLDRVGVPRRFQGMAFDAILQAEGQGWSRNRVAFMQYLKAGYVQGLNDLNAGQRMRLDVGVTRRIHSVALVGGSRRVKTAWASQTVEEKGTHPGAFAYYQFGELQSMLSDYKRMDDQREFAEIMGRYALVVIDGIHGGKCGPGFPSAWDAGVAARQNSGLATILLCEEDHAIDSYAWRDMLDDPEMLVLPFRLDGQAAPGATNSPPALQVPPQAEDGIEDATERAVLKFIADFGEPIIKKIYESGAGPQSKVKTALDSLMARDRVRSKKKVGKDGRELTVFYAVKGAISDNQVVPAPSRESAEPGRNAPDKPLTYTELEEITQVPRTTLFRWRKAGLSDDEIVTRAEAERVP